MKRVVPAPMIRLAGAPGLPLPPKLSQLSISDMKLEKEIKLIATANTQIKFYNKSNYKDLFSKIEKLLNVLDIKIEYKYAASDRRTPTRRDVYFESDWFLADNKHSLSIRSYSKLDVDYQNRNIVTLKTNEEKMSGNNIQYITRMEHDADVTQQVLYTFLRDGITSTALNNFFPSVDIGLGDEDVLRKVGEAVIRRSLFSISVANQSFRLSIDKFYFLNYASNAFSETFTEVELESRVYNSEFHTRIKQLVTLLQCMFDVEPQPISKYQRFREFCASDAFEEFYFLGMDLIAYSKIASWNQKQIVQRFHKIIKDSIPALPKANPPIIISIGDGAIIAIPSGWPNLEKLMSKIESEVTKNNARDQARKIEYRTAVHYGSVFRFTDLNDAINIAGEGINVVSRILQSATNAKTLFSEQARNRIIDADQVSSERFRQTDSPDFKHGLAVRLYEYDKCVPGGGEARGG